MILNHFSQPIIKHDTDHYTADKGVDKAVFIILSLLTDKQAYFPETLKPSPQDSAPAAKCFCNHNKGGGGSISLAGCVFDSSVFATLFCLSYCVCVMH